MNNGRFLDLRSTPQALAALRTLCQQAAGPFVTPHNMGQAPVRSGTDIMRPLPVPQGVRQQVALAIDQHLASGAGGDFLLPLRMAPDHEAHVLWGIGEICRQRHLAASEAGHPLQQLSAGLPLAKQRPAAAAAVPPGARLLRAAEAAACRRVGAARRALPQARLTYLAQQSAQPLHKRQITFRQVQQLALALRQLRADQTTSLRLTGRGLRALAAAFPGYGRADHLRAAERRLLASRRERLAQAKLDDCLLAQAHAALAIKPRQG